MSARPASDPAYARARVPDASARSAAGASRRDRPGSGPFEQHFRTTALVRRPLEEVFAFFSDAANLERITPPELGFSILTPLPIAMREGTLIDYRLRLWGVPLRWRTLISVWDPPHRFVDEQLEGPYAQWIHSHRFEAVAEGTRMTDHVRYRLPFGVLGLPGLPLVRRQVRAIFHHRARVITELLEPGGLPRQGA